MPYHKIPNWTPEQGLEVLTFGLGGETFALEAGIVRGCCQSNANRSPHDAFRSLTAMFS